MIMARTNFSENDENSDDEVILRIKKKTTSKTFTLNDDNSTSTSKISSSSPSSIDPSGEKIFLIKKYSFVGAASTASQISSSPSTSSSSSPINCREKSKLSTSLSTPATVTSADLETIKTLLTSEKANIWRCEGNSLVVPDFGRTGDVGERPKSMPNSTLKRDSLLRQSWNNIWRRSFNRSSSKNSGHISSSNSSGSGSGSEGNAPKIEPDSKECSGADDSDGYCVVELRRKSVIPEECDSGSSSISDTNCLNRSTNSVGLGIRSAPSSPMAPLQGQSEAHGQSVVSLNTITRSPSHHQTTKLDSKSLKQLSTSAPVAASTLRSVSPHTKSSSSSRNDIPEKEKKRKELSSSRQKKFHRHFQQVSKDERVLNYFSCALVSDILLQGHLYITKNYFAFYSNVFGFVTKLLIPTASVIKISKEKTAKIIPNAVGVATADERHVFGSFMSREAAYRLMCSVCIPLEPAEVECIPKIVREIEASEEYSVEDDSSCSISGNESPPHLLDSTSDASQSLRQRSLTGNSFIVPSDAVDGPVPIAGAKENGEEKLEVPLTAKIIGGAKSSTTPVKISSKSPPPRMVSTTRIIKIKFPTDFHVVYLGVVLAIVLALFSGFLLYRIIDIEAKTNYHSSLEFKWGSGNDIDVYAEALKWQKEMQSKSTEEAQIILNTNLEQIAKVRKSLETLSLLIHDKGSQSSQFDHMSSGVSDQNSAMNRGGS